jgi:hypothetical protein
METKQMSTSQFKAFLITLLELVRKTKDPKEIEKYLEELIMSL